MKYKIILSIFILVLLVGLVSAFEFDNVKSYNEDTKTIVINNAFNLPFFGSKIAEYTLLRNTHTCLINCEAEGISTLYMDNSLFQNMRFENRKGEDKIINFQIYIIETKERIRWIEEYSDPSNKTLISNKSQVTTYEEEVRYNFEELKEGTYKWIIKASKDPHESIDWIGLSNGIELIDWAWWDALPGDFEIFNNTGADTFTVPAGVSSVNVLVVGAGGGGGDTIGAGGGAGRLILNETYITNISEGNVITVIVGTGGIGATGPGDDGTSGGNSTFGILSMGGGGGGSGLSGGAGLDGASGGGGARAQVGGNALFTAQGFDGGDGAAVNAGGGGGGMSSAGTDGVSSTGGNGGNGNITIWGLIANLSCGGGGGGDSVGGAAGCSSAGFGTVTSNAPDADDNSGSGGGGGGSSGGNFDGGDGGSGLVIVRFNVSIVPIITIFSPTNTTFSISTIFFNATTNQTITEFIVNYNGTNITSFTINTTLEVEDGFHHLFLYANGTDTPTAWGLNDSVFFTVDTAPIIKVFSPTNTSFATSTIFFNATNSSQPVDKWIVNYNGTNVTLSDINTTLEVEDGNNFNLLLYANNSVTGGFGLNDTIFFSVDTSNPSLNVTEPFGVINFKDISENQTLRFNVSDINLDTCLFDYEGSNTTVDCTTNITNFTVGTDRTLTFFANDTFGNLVSQVVTWSYLVLQTSTTFNSSSFETAEERFTVNVTTNGSVITAGSLTFNGIENTGATITSFTGNNFSIIKTIAIPTSIGTKTHNFNLTIIGKIINTTAQTQVINATNFTLCQSAPLNIPFINISFKNETLVEEDINATISSTWTFSLSALSGVNKTLTFSEATQKLNYTFCADPSDRNLNIDLTMTYNNDISQQRSFLLTTTLSSTLLTQVLFLLPTTDGLFSPFKTVTINGDTITNVKAIITRIIGGITVTITSGFTDGSGFITFFLDPDETYTATFSKIPFIDNTFGFVPTADLRTVTMGGGGIISNGTVITRGTIYFIDPKISTLDNNTAFTFTFNVSSNLTTITLISMNITNSSNAELLFVSNAGVGNLSGILNTGNNTKLFGSYIIQTGEETISVTRIWIIFATFIGDYSIFTQLTLVTENELISDFMRLMLILAVMISVIIFMSVGQIIESNESKIAVILLLTWAFSIVGWLDTGLAVSTTSSGINRLGELSNQFGIAIVMSGASVLFILGRLLIRKI